MVGKICSLCSVNKSLTEFYTRRNSVDGKTSQCRQCEKKRKLRYYYSDKVAAAVRAKNYKLNNSDHLNKQQRLRIKTDINYRLSKNLRNRLNQIIRKNKTTKAGSAIRDLGCSLLEFRSHISDLFQHGMSWDNYGDWHLDHINPLCGFDLSDRTQFLKACHFTNIQPLWAEENQSKGGR